MQTETPTRAVQFGQVSKFWPDRGYGFIAPDDGGSIWVHAKNVEGGLGELVPGDRVSFSIGKGSKGPKAIRVRVLKP